MGYLKTILDKTGVAGTTGANTNPLPATNDADAKSETFFHGLHFHEPIEVVFTRSTQDGNFALEGTSDGVNYYALAFRRMDLDTVVAGTLTLNANTRLLIDLPQATQNSRIIGMRCACWLAAAGAAGDRFVVKVWEGR